MTVISERRMGKTGLVEEDLIEEIYDYFNGVTWYLQLAMNESFAMTLPAATIGKGQFETIITHIVDTKRFTFEDKYATMTGNRKHLSRRWLMNTLRQLPQPARILSYATT